MVGRELLLICPHGEDHRGHERGEILGDARLGRRHDWRRWIVRRMYTGGSWCGAVDTGRSMEGEGRGGDLWIMRT